MTASSSGFVFGEKLEERVTEAAAQNETQSSPSPADPTAASAATGAMRYDMEISKLNEILDCRDKKYKSGPE